MKRSGGGALLLVIASLARGSVVGGGGVLEFPTEPKSNANATSQVWARRRLVEEAGGGLPEGCEEPRRRSLLKSDDDDDDDKAGDDDVDDDDADDNDDDKSATTEETGEPPRGLLVLKQARSGSSWFASLVRKMHGISFFEEIITAKTGQMYSDEKKETYLTAVLTGRTAIEKVKLVKNFKTLLAKKGKSSSLSKRLVVGGTMNPAGANSETKAADGLLKYKIVKFDGSASGVNLNKILTLTHSKLVMYIRTNVVKMAVARCRGHELVAKCNGINTLQGKDCRIPKMSKIDPTYLLSMVMTSISKNALNVDATDATGVPYETFTYEDLQIDKVGQLRRLKVEVMGLPWLGPQTEGLCTAGDRFVKSTGESLRSVLVKYDETLAAWEGALIPDSTTEQKFAKDCILRMFKVEEPTTFPDCLATKNGGGLRTKIFE